MKEQLKRILIVDDEPDTVIFLSTLFQDEGFAVQVAADGAEAIRMIEENPPGLITLDITMPEKSGVAVYRFVKEDGRYRAIPVIIVTGIAREFEKFISTRRQVPPPEGYISKPVDPQELIKMVRDLLQVPAAL